jgi:large subunit ribosomal protein L24
MKKHIKTGDEVVVIAGNSRGNRAKVLSISLSNDRVLVEGINKHKHFEKKTEQNPKGGIVERESPIHISNVMLATDYDQSKAAAAKK